MTKLLGDPVLRAGAFTVNAGKNLFALATALVLLAVPLAIVYSDKILQAAYSHWSITESRLPVGSLVALMLLVAVVLALWWLFFGNLSHIVDTVVQGDPFFSENADRLLHMAGLLLAIQLVYIPTAAFGLIVETALKGPTSTVDIFWDFTGLVMVLTLFVFAHIFRQGADMRNDLEGTI